MAELLADLLVPMMTAFQAKHVQHMDPEMLEEFEKLRGTIDDVMRSHAQCSGRPQVKSRDAARSQAIDQGAPCPAGQGIVGADGSRRKRLDR